MNETYTDLECGLIIGSIVARLENDKIISFTEDFNYDGKFIELAQNLITEFNSDTIVDSNKDEDHYFSMFVEKRLKEMQKEISA